MKLLDVKIVTAIRGGDLKYLKQVLEVSTPDEVRQLLGTRQQDSALLRRPSNRREMWIRSPTPLMVAVTGWCVDIVEYIASFKVGLDDDSTVDDHTNTPPVYTGVTALHLAAVAGKLKMVQSLIRHGACVNLTTALGDTPLFEACFEGHQPIVQHLVENGGDPGIANQRLTTCVMIAAYVDNVSVVKYLLEINADLSGRDHHGRNVLFYVVSGGRLDTLIYLLDHGGRAEVDSQGVNILMEAVRHSQTQIVDYLTSYHSVVQLDPDAQDEAGRNVLFYLAEHEDTAMLETLLRWGVLIEPANDARSLLMTSCLKGNTRLARYLVENADKLGVDINELDSKGRNCLFYCITGGDAELFQYLVGAGVVVRASGEGVTLVMQAVAKNRPEFLDLLLYCETYKQSVDSQDGDGWDALMYAVASGHLPLFKMLTGQGAHSHPANDGRTIVMQAAAKGDVSFLRHILDNGRRLLVYVHQRDRDGWNALFYTVLGGHLEAFKFLLKRGAKVSAALTGVNLLMEAVDKDQPQFVEYLLHSAGTLGIDINERDHEGNNVLFYAMATGQVTMFERLLTAGCDVQTDYNNRTLLMQAALHGHARAVKYIVENCQSLNIDLQQRDKGGRNALFYCIEGGHLNILRYLLDAGIECETDDTGSTILMQAVRAADMPITRYLLDNCLFLNVDLNARDERGENALFYAVRSEDMAVVEALLQAEIQVINNNEGINVLSQSLCDGKHRVVDAILTSGVDFAGVVNGKDIRGRSVLFHYVEKGDVDMLCKLGQYYNKDSDHDMRGATLLMRACMLPDRITTVQYLVETLKVDTSASDVKQRTALFYAVDAGNVEAVTYLLQHMVTIRPDENGVTVLMLAASLGHTAIVHELLNSKCGRSMMDEKDSWGQGAAHYTALQGRDVVINILHSQGCDLNIQDTDGITPVMCACAQGHVATVTSLLRNGAAVDLLDKTQRNALHYCFGRNPSLRCVKGLLQYGIDVNQADNSQLTPLMLACQTCSRTQIALIKELLDWGADPVLQDKDGKDAFDHCPYDTSYVRALMQEKSEMEDGQKAALLKHRPQLTEVVQLNSVLRGLLRRQIFTKTLNFEVMKTPAHERVSRMLELLSMRGERAFRSFCDVLKEESEVELAYSLLKEAYRKPHEIYW